MGWQLKCQFLIRVFVAYFLLNAQFCVNIIQVMTQYGANIMGLYILFWNVHPSACCKHDLVMWPRNWPCDQLLPAHLCGGDILIPCLPPDSWLLMFTARWLMTMSPYTGSMFVYQTRRCWCEETCRAQVAGALVCSCWIGKNQKMLPSMKRTLTWSMASWRFLLFLGGSGRVRIYLGGRGVLTFYLSNNSRSYSREPSSMNFV